MCVLVLIYVSHTVLEIDRQLLVCSRVAHAMAFTEILALQTDSSTMDHLRPSMVAYSSTPSAHRHLMLLPIQTLAMLAHEVARRT
eukprot:SAG31_NODE_834_length_11650_cov_7.572245_3_plen_85_part_00